MMKAVDRTRARNSISAVSWIILLIVAAIATGQSSRCVWGSPGTRAVGGDSVPRAGTAAGGTAQAVIELLPAERQLLERVMGAGVVGKAVPASPIQNPSAFFPLKPMTLAYQSIRSGRKRKRVEHEIRPRQQAGPGTRWEYATGPRAVSHLLLSADGSISVRSQEDGRNDAIVHFTPAEPVLLKGMQPGETRESRIDVRVYDRRQVDQLRYTGRLKLTYTYIGSYQVQVPAGSYTTLLFRSHHQGKLGPARIKETQYRFFAAGIGPVAIASQSDVRAFWVYRDVSTNARLLMHPAVQLGSR